MANPKIRWNISAFEEIRRSPEVDDMLQDVVDDVMSQLDGSLGYDSDVGRGRTRSRGSVWTADFDAILDNDQNDSLLKALNAARVGE